MGSEFRQLLEAGDVDALCKVWYRVAAHLPQPENRDQAEIIMHIARTAAASVAFKHRAYSHRWLTERLLPSSLPHGLRGLAEKPVIVDAVGVSINFRSEALRPAADEVHGAINGAIEECYADRRTDPVFVSERMREAKTRVMKALFGRS